MTTSHNVPDVKRRRSKDTARDLAQLVDYTPMSAAVRVEGQRLVAEVEAMQLLCGLAFGQLRTALEHVKHSALRCEMQQVIDRLEGVK